MDLLVLQALFHLCDFALSHVQEDMQLVTPSEVELLVGLDFKQVEETKDLDTIKQKRLKICHFM